MSTWANALKQTKLDIAEGGPAIVWEISSHEIGSGESEDFQINRIDCRGKTANNISFSGVKTSSGSGVPKVYAVWMDEQNNELAEVELSTGTNKVIGRFLKLRVKETNSNIATYSAVIRLD